MSEESRNSGPAEQPGDAHVERLYREAAREEPPADLDAAILAAARREAGAGPRPIAPRWLRSWRLPTSIAAVVVLAASIVTLVMEQGEERLTLPAPQVPAASAPPSERPPAGPPREIARTERQAKPPAVPAPAREAQREAAAPQEKKEPGDDRSSGRDTGAIGQAKAPPAAEQSPEPAPLMRSERPHTEMRAAPLAAPARKSALLRELENEAPEKWLDKIQELRREGDSDEADQLLTEFRKRFPEHPLPAALR